MGIQEFAAIGIVGALISLLIQMLKGRYGTDSTSTKLLTIALAIGFGSFYVLVRDTQYFQTVLTILGSSSTIYALFLKK